MDRIWAIERLEKFFTQIIIERVGIASTRDPLEWDRLQKDLNNRYPGQLTFVDRLPNMPDIWQDSNEYGWHDYDLKEIGKIGLEELARLKVRKETDS